MKVKYVILFAILFLSNHARANLLTTADPLAHFAAHFTASAAVFSTVYIIMHDGFGLPKSDSFIAGATSALAIGLIYKLTESAAEGYLSPNFSHAMLYNTIGVAVPSAIFIGFDL